MSKLILIFVVAHNMTDGRTIEQRSTLPDMATCERIADTINAAHEGPWEFKAACEEGTDA